MNKEPKIVVLGYGRVLTQVFVNEYNDGKLGILMQTVDISRTPGPCTDIPDINPDEADVHLVFKDLACGIETLDLWKSLLIKAQEYIESKGEENNGTL